MEVDRVTVAIVGDNRGLGQALDESRRKVRQAAGDMEREARGAARGFDALGTAGAFMGGVVAGGIAVAGAALMDFGRKAVMAAVNVEELNSKMAVTFGRNAQDVEEWAQRTGDALGRTATELKLAATDFQVLLGRAIDPDQAAEFSKQLAVLVQDLSSFHNVSADIAQTAVFSGLVGETEPLRRFGVVLNEATVQAKALELGLARTKDELSENDKMAARLTLILEQTRDAQGDVARTSYSTANKMREASSATAKLSEKLGALLTPAINEAAGAWAGFADWLSTILDRYSRFTESLDNADPKIRQMIETLGVFRGVVPGGFIIPDLDNTPQPGPAPRQSFRPGTAAATVFNGQAPRGGGQSARVLTPFGGPGTPRPQPGGTPASSGGGSRRSPPSASSTMFDRGYLDALADPLQNTSGILRKNAVDGKDFQIVLADVAREAELIATSFHDINDRLPESVDLTSEWSKVSQEWAASWQENVADMIASAGAGFDDIGSLFKRMLQQMAYDYIRAGVMDWFKAIGTEQSLGGGGGKGGGGGGWGTALRVAASIFGFGKAAGGPVEAGGLYRVNELGEEYFMPSKDGVIVNPALMPKAFGGGSGGGATTVAVRIDLAGANGDETIRRIAYEAATEGTARGLALARKVIPADMRRNNAQRFR